MKKFLFCTLTLFLSMLVTSCKTGSYSLSSGLPDQATLSVVFHDKMPIFIEIDGVKQEINTIKQQAWKKNRDIKATAKNAVIISTGRHKIVIYTTQNTELYRHEIFVSAGEHKIIEL